MLLLQAKDSVLPTVFDTLSAPMNNVDELVDLVDSSGIIRKKGILRSKANAYPGLYLQIVIAVVINTEGKILVHKRAQTKRVNPGDIDHICGGIISGETPQKTAIREALEETGIKPRNVKIITHGVNKYNRYRYLLLGESNDIPGKVDPAEVEWVRFIDLNELRQKQVSREFTFVDEFFEDAILVVKYSSFS